MTEEWLRSAIDVRSRDVLALWLRHLVLLGRWWYPHALPVVHDRDAAEKVRQGIHEVALVLASQLAFVVDAEAADGAYPPEALLDVVLSKCSTFGCTRDVMDAARWAVDGPPPDA